MATKEWKNKIEQGIHLVRPHIVGHKTALELIFSGVNEAEQEIERLKGLLSQIDKSLYLGKDLDDIEILKWYIDVVTTIKDEIKETLKTDKQW